MNQLKYLVWVVFACMSSMALGHDTRLMSASVVDNASQLQQSDGAWDAVARQNQAQENLLKRDDRQRSQNEHDMNSTLGHDAGSAQIEMGIEQRAEKLGADSES